MIDLIDLKENLDIYKKGLSAKGCDIDLEDLLKNISNLSDENVNISIYSKSGAFE